MPTYFLYWVVYGIVGWIMETIYCSVPEGKFVERGFLNGPIVPIYGFGAMIVLFFLEPFFNNPFLVFVFGFLLTSILEYITSYIMEKSFGMRWWDYSRYKFNIKGRVCLLNSTLFGLLCVILVEWVHPVVIKLVSLLNPTSQLNLALLLLLIIGADFIVSLISVLNLKQRLATLNQLYEELQSILQNINEKNQDRMLELKQKIIEVKQSFKTSERRLIRAFPTMNSKKFDKIFSEIKESISQFTNK